MVIVKCKECGQEYELEDDNNPSDFKCECGGNLEFKESIEPDYDAESEGRDKIMHGYSLTDQKSFNYKITMILGVALLVIGILGIVTLNIFGFILAFAGFLLIYLGYRKGYSWIKGDKGEKIVSKYLGNLPSGYFVLNDVNIPKGKGNIDHLVIGPTGIFLIETKNYSGSFKIDGDEWQRLAGYSYKKIKKNPARQVKLNALDLGKFLNKKLGKKVWVNAVVTLLNNDFKVIKEPKYYSVLGADELTQFILNYNKKIPKETINAVLNFMQDYSTEIHYKKEDVELE